MVAGSYKSGLVVFSLCLVIFFSVADTICGDVIYEEEITTGPQPQRQERRLVYLKGKMQREETFIPQAGRITIIRFDKDWVWIGDKATKTFSRGNWDEMASRLLMASPKPALEIKASGEKKELLGYITEKFLIKEDNDGSTATIEVYLAYDLPGALEVNKFNAFLWEQLDLKSEFKASWRGKIKGFPLLTIQKETGPSGQEKITTTRLTSFREVLMDAKEFEAPLVLK
jgi:hypothetical protein